MKTRLQGNPPWRALMWVAVVPVFIAVAVLMLYV